MDLAYVISLTTWFVLLSLSGVRSATVVLTKSAEKGQLGNNSLSLFCDYSLSAGEIVSYINLKRKRSTDSSFVPVIVYSESSLNASYYPEASDLVGRTVTTNPISSNRRAILQFNSILCTDEADYQCELGYTTPFPRTINSSTRIVVTATPIFENQSLPYTPSTNLAENQTVTFTCIGNVGREPQGNFAWYKYVEGQTQGVIPITNGIKSVSNTSAPGSCTYVRTETMTMTLTKEDNQMVIRCTVQQSTLTEAGDGNIQTDRINVYYAPRINSIRSSPALSVYYEGLPQLMLTSDANSNPPSNYVWILPDGTEKSGSQLFLTNLTTNHTGMYTFMAYTGWGGQNYTASSSINITVVATTTQPPTTTTTTTRSSSTVSSTKTPGTAANGGVNTESAVSKPMIIGIVVGGVVLIAVIIIVIVCIKKRKKQEIEEPAEKPRNNRDIVFSGNRPDVVETNEKWRNNQNNQNVNLNNSYDSSDSTKKGDSQLTYVDLQFDDKPRSRKPIQLLDSTPYADIAMPRV